MKKITQKQLDLMKNSGVSVKRKLNNESGKVRKVEPDKKVVNKPEPAPAVKKEKPQNSEVDSQLKAENEALRVLVAQNSEAFILLSQKIAKISDSSRGSEKDMDLQIVRDQEAKGDYKPIKSIKLRVIR